jgi:hypothetical protein
MLSDEEILRLAHSCLAVLLRCGNAWGLSSEAQVILNELQRAARSEGSKSQKAYEVCRKALELYWRESGIGGLFYIVNSRLRKVRSIRSTTMDGYLRAVTESCEELADFRSISVGRIELRVSRDTERRCVDIPRCRAFGGVAGELPQRRWEVDRLADLLGFRGEA